MSGRPRRMVWLVAWVSVASSVLVATLVVRDAAVEVLLGMAGPVVVAVGSFTAMDRVYRRNPERLTRLMVQAFVGKMVLFGAYVVGALTALSLDAIAFAASFTVYFVALHVAEAADLQRLLAGGLTPPD